MRLKENLASYCVSHDIEGFAYIDALVSFFYVDNMGYNTEKARKGMPITIAFGRKLVVTYIFGGERIPEFNQYRIAVNTILPESMIKYSNKEEDNSELIEPFKSAYENAVYEILEAVAQRVNHEDS